MRRAAWAPHERCGRGWRCCSGYFGGRESGRRLLLSPPALGNSAPGASCRRLWRRGEGAGGRGLRREAAPARSGVSRAAACLFAEPLLPPGRPRRRGESRRPPSLCSPGREGGDLRAAAWWRFLRRRLRLAAGRRHCSRRHFCCAPTPPVAAARAAGYVTAAAREAGGEGTAEQNRVCLSLCCSRGCSHSWTLCPPGVCKNVAFVTLMPLARFTEQAL